MLRNASNPGGDHGLSDVDGDGKPHPLEKLRAHLPLSFKTMAPWEAVELPDGPSRVTGALSGVRCAVIG